MDAAYHPDDIIPMATDRLSPPCLLAEMPCAMPESDELSERKALRYVDASSELATRPPIVDLPERSRELACRPDGDHDDNDNDWNHERCISEELEHRWILNLSMRFRDESNREKFFVTFAETSNRWRRLTISLTYADAPVGSLEAELRDIPYQREKSRLVYQAIRDSLGDIEYCETVTNLKLETSPEDGQLHIHVREDLNEVVEYPRDAAFGHVSCRRYRESEVNFVSHLSGFVYKVDVYGRTFVKKEVAGPDAIDEFLYEVNALSDLADREHVIELRGLITDASGELIKGLLLSYASRGALVDMLYDYAGTSQLQWSRRERWARQIIQGLSEIHEAGYVQGDFTLSNVVVDRYDDAAIIDINRRGCPMGWEPPELARLIESGQRISMYIGTKTDLFQLGMVLWALATGVDEPERVERPLSLLDEDAPPYFHRIVHICLSERPQDRWSARELLGLFPSAAHLGENTHNSKAEETALASWSLPERGIGKQSGRRGRSPRDMGQTRSASTYSSPAVTRPSSPVQCQALSKGEEKDFRIAGFVHVDSGFDETTVEDLTST